MKVQMISLKEAVGYFHQLPEESRQKFIRTMLKDSAQRSLEIINKKLGKSKLSDELPYELKNIIQTKAKKYFDSFNLTIEKMEKGKLSSDIGYAKILGYMTCLKMVEYTSSHPISKIGKENIKSDLEQAKSIYNSVAGMEEKIPKIEILGEVSPKELLKEGLMEKNEKEQFESLKYQFKLSVNTKINDCKNLNIIINEELRKSKGKGELQYSLGLKSEMINGVLRELYKIRSQVNKIN